MSTYITPGGKNNNQFEDCPDILREFLTYAGTIKNLSIRTVNGYYIDIRTFLRFMKLRRGLVDSSANFEEILINDVTLDFLGTVTKADVYEYLHYALNVRGNAAVTRARKLCSIKAFYKYLVSKSNQLKQNPVIDIEVPTIRKSLPKYLSLDESLELLNHVSGDFAERDYCILVLFLNCGMRLSELVSINTTDFKENTIRIVGKGDKERTVYLNDSCIYALNNYLKARSSLSKVIDKSALFLSKKTGKRLTPRRVQQIVDTCLQAAGLSGKGYSTHKLRHTAATLMYRHGNVDMLALKEILGHEHITTTEIYTHISTQQLENAIKSSPLSKVKIDKSVPKISSAPQLEHHTEEQFNESVNEDAKGTEDENPKDVGTAE